MPKYVKLSKGEIESLISEILKNGGADKLPTPTKNQEIDMSKNSSPVQVQERIPVVPFVFMDPKDEYHASVDQLCTVPINAIGIVNNLIVTKENHISGNNIIEDASKNDVRYYIRNCINSLEDYMTSCILESSFALITNILSVSKLKKASQEICIFSDLANWKETLNQSNGTQSKFKIRNLIDRAIYDIVFGNNSKNLKYDNTCVANEDYRYHSLVSISSYYIGVEVIWIIEQIINESIDRYIARVNNFRTDEFLDYVVKDLGITINGGNPSDPVFINQISVALKHLFASVLKMSLTSYIGPNITNIVINSLEASGIENLIPYADFKELLRKRKEYGDEFCD